MCVGERWEHARQRKEREERLTYPQRAFAGSGSHADGGEPATSCWAKSDRGSPLA
jgi:hypothetical protein